jgi:hypothetical protein
MTLPAVGDWLSFPPVPKPLGEPHSSSFPTGDLQVDVAKATEANLALHCVYQGAAGAASSQCGRHVQGEESQGIGSLVVMTVHANGARYIIVQERH